MSTVKQPLASLTHVLSNHFSDELIISVPMFKAYSSSSSLGSRRTVHQDMFQSGTTLRLHFNVRFKKQTNKKNKQVIQKILSFTRDVDLTMFTQYDKSQSCGIYSKQDMTDLKLSFLKYVNDFNRLSVLSITKSIFPGKMQLKNSFTHSSQNRFTDLN